ncbi:sensor histidine kinase [Cytophagaceae bacterium ABcell3]|nr:sensor histidine kinase [Cytophagaceae bacterium ABcell3]
MLEKIKKYLIILLEKTDSKITAILFLLLIFSFHAFGAPTIDLEKGVPSGYIGQYLLSLEDKEGELSIEDILQADTQNQFTVNHRSSIHFTPKESSSLWVKINVKNISLENYYYLSLQFPDVDELSFYGIEGDSVVEKEVVTGNLFNFYTREIPHPLFSFSLIPDCDTYYLRLKSTNPIHVALKVSEKHGLFQSYHTYDLWQGIFLGLSILVVMVFATTLIVEKNRLSVYYLLHVLGTVLIVGIYQGHAKQYFFPNSTFIHTYQTGLIALFSLPTIFFVCKFLNVKFINKSCRTTLLIIMQALLMIIVFDIAEMHNVSRVLLKVTAFVLTVFVLILGVFIASEGDRPTKIFVAGWVLYLTGVVCSVLLSAGLISYSLLTYNGFSIGVGVSIIFASVAVADRFQQYKRSNNKLEADMLEHLRKNEKLVKQQNMILEAKVSERTREIEQQRIEIELKNRIIRKQNNELIHYNTSLEQQVEDRTRALSKSYDEIKKKTLQLEQFNYVAAHNLRAPVSTLLGLTNIFNPQNVSPENLMVIEKIKETSLKLDHIIIDLNNILNVSDPANIIHEHFTLSEAFDKAQEMLQKEIYATETNVEVNFSECPEVYTVKPFLLSVFYNLLSNAIKYKSENRKPSIKVSSGYLDQNTLYILFEDNGMGIDLKAYGSKLFGLYKRFSFHVKGKGMGLFMVKTQVELMDGKIEVSSTPGVGTTFQIHLPVKKVKKKVSKTETSQL